jgi:glycosyltransferase involved in cell wall biosynthesis
MLSMRVLLIHNRYRFPGGEDIAVAADVSLLREGGHQVLVHEVVNPTGQAATASALARVPWNLSARQEVQQRIWEFRPDVVHVHNIWFSLGPLVLRAAAQAGIPVVMTAHNYRLICAGGTLFRDGRVCGECVGSHPWRAVAHRCYRDSRVASFASALTTAVHRAAATWDGVTYFLAPTAFVREQLVAGGIPGERVRVRSNYAPDPGSRPNPPSWSSMVLFVGRLTNEKGVEGLVHAWEQLASDKLELVIVGDGPLRERLEARCSPNIRFTGHLPPGDVASLMLRARCLTVPTPAAFLM